MTTLSLTTKCAIYRQFLTSLLACITDPAHYPPKQVVCNLLLDEVSIELVNRLRKACDELSQSLGLLEFDA